MYFSKQFIVCIAFYIPFVEKEEKTKTDNKEKKEASNGTSPRPGTTDDEEIEVVEEDEVNLEDSYEEWLRETRNRGFKRTGPTSQAEKTNGKQSKNEPKKSAKPSAPPEPASCHSPTQPQLKLGVTK